MDNIVFVENEIFRAINTHHERAERYGRATEIVRADQERALSVGPDYVTLP